MQRSVAPASLRGARAPAITIFCAYIAFVLAGLAFFTLADDRAVHMAMEQHLSLTLAWLTVEAGAVVALCAVLAGGIPLALAAAIKAAGRHPLDLLLLVVPVPAFVFYLLADGVGFAGGGLASPLAGVVRVAAGIALASISTLAVCAAITRNVRGRFLYRLALAPATAVVGAMALMLVGTLLWGALAGTAEPQLFRAGAGLLGAPAWLTWVAIALSMIASTCVAAGALLRGIVSRETARELRMALAALVNAGRFARGLAAGPRHLSPLETVRERYARGEIDYSTLRQRVSTLLDS